MTEGEITFHLREICAQWTKPRMTSSTAAELERIGLIEFSEDRLETRLTPEGVRRKNASRANLVQVGAKWLRTRQQSKQQKPRNPRRFVMALKPLV